MVYRQFMHFSLMVSSSLQATGSRYCSWTIRFYAPLDVDTLLFDIYCLDVCYFSVTILNYCLVNGWTLIPLSDIVVFMTSKFGIGHLIGQLIIGLGLLMFVELKASNNFIQAVVIEFVSIYPFL